MNGSRKRSINPLNWVRDLPPLYFAMVMATGIASRGLQANHREHAAGVLLVLAVVAFAVLLAGTLLRLIRYRAAVLADEVNPSRSFAFFTFVAGANVIATRMAEDGHLAVAAAFLVVGTLSWVVLGYTLPSILIIRHGMRPALAGADGSWFLWVVGAQSIVVAITALPASRAGWLEPVAVSGWCVGVVLYLAVAILVLGRLFAFPVRPAQLTPSYWVFMGATAITALAGARILHWTSSPLIAAVTPVVAGISVLLWAFGTWLIPLLIALSAWHEEARLPLLYEPGLWSIVFPVGMYGVACRELGSALGVRWMAELGSGVIWAGVALWLVVFVGMIVSLLRGLIAQESLTPRPRL
ncbi:MAG: tellurite resistance/C4-dicarboxylate transporter family protein [Sciscionella sp.]